MKTVIIRVQVGGRCVGGTTVLKKNWFTGKYYQETIRPGQKSIDSIILDARSKRTKIINDFFADMRVRLARGGFEFQSSLYKFFEKQEWRGNNTFCLIYYSDVSFEDNYNEGKSVLMNSIYRTGVLNDGKIIKAYS